MKNTKKAIYFCKYCGSRLEDSDEYCSCCGEKRNAELYIPPEEIPEEKYICRNCGGELKDGDKYCRRCGMKRNAEKFVPEDNGDKVLCVYAPPVAYLFECENCGHKWAEDVFDGHHTKHCPDCGCEITTHTEKYLWDLDEEEKR